MGTLVTSNQLLVVNSALWNNSKPTAEVGHESTASAPAGAKFSIGAAEVCKV